jgi:hypothetical protein
MSFTQLWLPSTGAAAVSPAFDSWSSTSGATRLASVLTKISSAMTNFAVNNGGSANPNKLDLQFVSGPLAAQTISGTVKCYARALRGGSTTQWKTRISIRVCNNAGSSFTGTLLTLGAFGNNTILNTSLRNMAFAISGTSLTSLAINDGDRLVVELGANNGGNGADTLTINFGDNSATDLGENETDTAANNPWIEFSNAIRLQGEGVIPVFMASYRRRREG